MTKPNWHYWLTGFLQGVFLTMAIGGVALMIRNKEVIEERDKNHAVNLERCDLALRVQRETFNICINNLQNSHNREEDYTARWNNCEKEKEK